MPTGHKITMATFLQRAREKHGDLYDYSLVNLVKSSAPVDIICRKHGVFRQTPAHHCSGEGCPECKREKSRRVICGVGINDAKDTIFDKPAYQVWVNMIKRCYDEKVIARRPAYRGCRVCDEWLRLSNFASWYEKNCKQGDQIDKDILIKGNKLYSPDTCLGVPRRINALFISARAVRGKYPIGVVRHNNKYDAQINFGCGSQRIGSYDTPEEAFAAYKGAKEAYIKKIAEECYSGGEITKRVFDALMRYKVEITD